jgi:hypothetical protein
MILSFHALPASFVDHRFLPNVLRNPDEDCKTGTGKNSYPEALDSSISPCNPSQEY